MPTTSNPLHTILSATGHRPDKLGGHSPSAMRKLNHFAIARLAELQASLVQPQVISGMALGWDTAIALAALELSIPLICAIPFPNQPARWPSSAVQQWTEIKRAAARVYIVSPEYTPECFQQRNEWMIDNCHQVLALWNGSQGGTANCLRYAARLRRPVTNYWPRFVRDTKFKPRPEELI